MGRCTAGPGHKIAKTTPCKVECSSFVSFAPRRQTDAKRSAYGDVEYRFNATDQRAAIRRQQSHGEPRLVRGRGYASKTSASVRRRLDLRDIGQSIGCCDHENRTGGGRSAKCAAACGVLFAANTATVGNQQRSIWCHDAGMGRKSRECSATPMR